MTTARERYEAKTKVVTFRVHKDLYEELENVKNGAELSYADLIKLGAGVTVEEVRSKSAKIISLTAQLKELEAKLNRKTQEQYKLLEKAKAEQLTKMEVEYRVFKFFDAGWSLEEVSLKTGVNHKEIFAYHQEWAEMRKQYDASREELLKQCLKKHIKSLEEQLIWAGTSFRWSDQQKQQLKDQIEYCRDLQSDLSMVSSKERTYLINEYSSRLWF